MTDQGLHQHGPDCQIACGREAGREGLTPFRVVNALIDGGFVSPVHDGQAAEHIRPLFVAHGATGEGLREALERVLRSRARGGEGRGFNADMHEEEVVTAILADPGIRAALAAHPQAGPETLRATVVDAAVEWVTAHDALAMGSPTGPPDNELLERYSEACNDLLAVVSQNRAALSPTTPEPGA